MNAQMLQKIRSDFPALEQKIRGKDLIYLDSAATTLKPRMVADRLHHFYLYESSNVHRGAHYLSDKATEAFEGARQKVASFLGADSAEEIVFVRGTTEGLNLLASTLGKKLEPGDEILLTEMEHHANIVPWQMLAKEKQLVIKFVKVTDSGELDLESVKSLLSKRTKIFSFTACSNTLGTVTDYVGLTKLAKAQGAIVIIDGDQIVSQEKIDVKNIDCDFFVFSAHKLFGPFGIGCVFGKASLWRDLAPYQGGGSMISEVTFNGVTFNDPPHRFEAGTPHIAGVVGFGAAIDYFTGLDLAAIKLHEAELLKVATEELSKISGLRIIGTARHKGPTVSFVIDGAHHSDIGQILDHQGVAVRAGHHCTQPLMSRLGIVGTVRASFSIYNTVDEVYALVGATKKAQEMLL